MDHTLIALHLIAFISWIFLHAWMYKNVPDDNHQSLGRVLFNLIFSYSVLVGVIYLVAWGISEAKVELGY